MGQTSPIVAQIPDSATIRAELGKHLRETDILRRMLKIALQAEKERSYQASDRAEASKRVNGHVG